MGKHVEIDYQANEINRNRETIKKLEDRVIELVSLNQILKVKNKRLGHQINDVKHQFAPIKEQINSLTSERGKWLRKLKRAGVK